MARRSDLIAWGLAAALLAGAAVPALAQPRPEAATSIVGGWTFETGAFGGDPGNCRMTGTMTIARPGPDGAFSCTLVAEQVCKGGGRRSAQQTCTARRTGNALQITSTVVRVTPAESEYAADNWSLTIQSSDLMIGQLRSAAIADARFTRRPAYTS